MLPIDSSVQAEYEDGFILDETELDDLNPYGKGNTFTAILNRLPEEAHGKTVRFSVFWKDTRYDIDMSALPDNARPIRFRHGYSTLNTTTGEIVSGFSGVDFGIQWNDSEGKNQKEVHELR